MPDNQIPEDIVSLLRSDIEVRAQETINRKEVELKSLEITDKENERQFKYYEGSLKIAEKNLEVLCWLAHILLPKCPTYRSSYLRKYTVNSVFVVFFREI